MDVENAISMSSRCHIVAATSKRKYYFVVDDWKFLILSSHLGTSMMVPQYPPKPEQLVDVLHGDYGSLHVTREPAVKCGMHAVGMNF